MSLQQAIGFSKLALQLKKQGAVWQGTLMRMAYHAEGKDFKAFLEEQSDGAE